MSEAKQDKPRTKSAIYGLTVKLFPILERCDFRVFISASSKELGSVRKKIAEVVRNCDCQPVSQDDFSIGDSSLRAKLENEIAQCDAVIHIVGNNYGAEPQTFLAGEERQSYTQMEYFIAKKFNKKVFVCLLDPSFPPDTLIEESPEKIELQQKYRNQFSKEGKHYCRPVNFEELKDEIYAIQLKSIRSKEFLKNSIPKAVIVLILVSIGVSVLFLLLGWAGLHNNNLASENQIVREQAKQLEDRSKDLLLQTRFDKLVQQYLLPPYELTQKEAQTRSIQELAPANGITAEVLRTKLDGLLETTGASPTEQAQNALRKQDYEEVFRLGKEYPMIYEVAMAEGTAALAKYRDFPDPKYRDQAIEAFRAAPLLVNSGKEPQKWFDASSAIVRLQIEKADFASAEETAIELIQKSETLFGKSSPQVADSLNHLAEICNQTNRMRPAEMLSRRAIAIARNSQGEPLLNLSDYLASLSYSLGQTDRFEPAEQLVRHAIAMDEKSPTQKQVPATEKVNNLAVIYQQRAFLPLIDALSVRVIQVFEKYRGPKHHSVSIAVNNLAVYLSFTGRNESAETTQLLSLAIAERALGSDHPEAGRSLGNYAYLLSREKKYKEAEPLFRRSLLLFERFGEKNNVGAASVAHNLALLLFETDRKDEAIALMKGSLQIFLVYHQQSGAPHGDEPLVVRDLRDLMNKVGKTEEEITATLQDLPKLLPPESLSDLVHQLLDGGTAYEIDLDEPFVDKLLERFPGLQVNELGIGTQLEFVKRPNAGLTYFSGLAYMESANDALAKLYFDEAIRLAPDWKQIRETLMARIARVRALRNLADFEQAATECRQLIADLGTLPDQDSLRRVAEIHLSFILASTGNIDEAKVFVEAATKYEEGQVVDPKVKAESDKFADALASGQFPVAVNPEERLEKLRKAKIAFEATQKLLEATIDQPISGLLDQIRGPLPPLESCLNDSFGKSPESEKWGKTMLDLNQPIGTRVNELLSEPAFN